MSLGFVWCESELKQKCCALAGISIGQLAVSLNLTIPDDPLRRKGWLGQAIETYLGADAGSKSLPDFQHLGIELKTIPVNSNYQPLESTFVCTIPLLSIHQQTWETSQCWQKLAKVLWVPVEGTKAINFSHRRIGQAFLWVPTVEQQSILHQDWQFLTDMIVSGNLDQIDASLGVYLQIRPKGSNARDLVAAFDTSGNKMLTLPRGFYLRTRFTATIMQLAKG